MSLERLLPCKSAGTNEVINPEVCSMCVSADGKANVFRNRHNSSHSDFQSHSVRNTPRNECANLSVKVCRDAPVSTELSAEVSVPPTRLVVTSKYDAFRSLRRKVSLALEGPVPC